MEEYAAEQNVEVLQIVDETQEIELEPQEEMIGLGYERFLNMTDGEIAELANNDDPLASDYLLNKYKNFVRAKARSYFLIGADREDLVQELSLIHI